MTRGEKTFFLIFGISVIGLIALAIFVRAHNPSLASQNSTIGATLADPANLPGLNTKDQPWDANGTTLGARLLAMKFPQLSMEGSVLHIHQHIDIFVHGKVVPVPANIGVATNFISPVHVHDATGVIHVESPVKATFTLGQFFDVWGVRLTSKSLGGYTADATNSLQVYINGKLVTGDPRVIPLNAHDEIAVVFGTGKEVPATVPSSYTFPAGE